jgi:hypothetical protein
MIEFLEDRSSPASLVGDMENIFNLLPTTGTLQTDTNPHAEIAIAGGCVSDFIDNNMYRFVNDINFVASPFKHCREIIPNNNYSLLGKNDDTLKGLLNILSAWLSQSTKELEGGRFVHAEPLMGPVTPPKSDVDVAGWANSNWLEEEREQGTSQPGWYLPVNWSDDDHDGWSPAENAPPTESSGPTYSGDLTDDFIPDGDRDLFKLYVSMGLVEIDGADPQTVDGDLKLTYDSSRMKIWETNTKKHENGTSSLVPSGTLFNWKEQLYAGAKFLYAEGIQGSTVFQDSWIKVEAVNLINAKPADPDEMKVTAFEINTRGIYTDGASKSQDNEVSFVVMRGSDNKLGFRDYITDPGITQYFANCMEMQGTIKPPVVVGARFPYGIGIPPEPPPGSEFYQVIGFDSIRYVYGVEFVQRASDGEWMLNPDQEHYQWTYDSLSTTSQDNTLSSESHIYDTDIPGFGFNQPLTYKAAEQYLDFKEWFRARLYGGMYQISSVAKWHTQTVIELDPGSNLLVRKKDPQGNYVDQKLGDGWIDIPIGLPN